MEPEAGDQFKPHVELLGDYSKSGFYNWLVPTDRQRFLGMISEAVHGDFFRYSG
jgi:hypothetical protein